MELLASLFAGFDSSHGSGAFKIEVAHRGTQILKMLDQSDECRFARSSGDFQKGTMCSFHDVLFEGFVHGRTNQTQQGICFLQIDSQLCCFEDIQCKANLVDNPFEVLRGGHDLMHAAIISVHRDAVIQPLFINCLSTIQ